MMLVMLLCCFAGAVNSEPGSREDVVVFPGEHWETKTPAQVGLDTAKLAEFAGAVGGRGCIVKDGYMVYSWGDITSKMDWASAMKPVMSTMLLFAVHEGKLPGVDALVNPYAEKVYGSSLNAKDQTMTFRHLADMISGYGRVEAPGEAWAYNDWAINLYSKTLFDGVFKEKPDSVAKADSRLGVLQIEDGTFFGSRKGYGLMMSPRDFARIGWFWLNKGNWNGKQILPESFFDDYMKADVPPDLPRSSAETSDYLKIYFTGGGTDQTPCGPGIYGFNWWFNTDRKTWPDAPEDTFQANGHWNGEVCCVIPSLNIVATWKGSGAPRDTFSQPMNDYLKILVNAGSVDTYMGKEPLRVHPTNPRYFTDDSGKVIYLTGVHTWNNMVDMGKDDPPQPFDFDGYLDFLQQHGHNFIRLWAWDSTTLDTGAARVGLQKDFVHNAAPQPWLRTGQENALDGKPKFDLTKFNPEYFARLRERVEAAGERGIYVSIMLFEGWALYHANRRDRVPEDWAWNSHPFHPDNNINGIGADLGPDGGKPKVHTMTNPEATAIQGAYIRKVVDTVNDLDNVLYEVINEGGDKDWDWWVVDTVHRYEKTKPKQHPVGITGHGSERLPSMLASPADWISPGRADGYGPEPPAWRGEKVSLIDTDHVWGVGGTHTWVWKSFVRGHNPLFMDTYDGSVLGESFAPRFKLLRLNLGYAMRYAKKMDMADMIPHEELASTQYCLANPGKEYLVYLPDGGKVTVDLSGVKGTFAVEWFNPRTGTATEGEMSTGGDKVEFTAPFDGDAVLYLILNQP